MTGQDWAPVVQAVIAGIGIVITTLMGVYIPIALAAVERRTHIALTDQDRAAIQTAVMTAAGLVQNKLDTGLLKARDVTPTNPVILQETSSALAAMPVSGGTTGPTLAEASAMVAARVDTSAKPVVAIVPKAVAP